MIFKCMPVGPMGANCYIVGCEQTRKGIVVDPGGEGERIVSQVQALNLEVEKLILTHGHIDHIMAVDQVREALGAEVLIHEADAPMLTDPERNLSGFMGAAFVFEPADATLVDGQKVQVGALQLTILHTPGHTPGGICLKLEDIVISGDTLFQGSIGRSDFPGGNGQLLVNSIKSKLMFLPEDTAVFPGHGGQTSIGYESRNNPFLR